MRIIRSGLWSMPWQQQKMITMNLLLCIFAKISIHCFSYQQIARYFGHNCLMLHASSLLSEKELKMTLTIKHSIDLTVRYLPWKSNCLTSALVAKYWCHRYQIPYLLFIGLAKNPSAVFNKDAHAWISAGPIAITGGQCYETHQIIATYSNIPFYS